MPAEVRRLPTGADLRLTGAGALAVVCLNGGTREPAPGTWSGSVEWLVRRLAPAFPRVRFAEVRYRVKSWRRLDLCTADARAALEAVTVAGSARVVLLGFSMGGAVGALVAGDRRVLALVGVAPWLPDELDLSPLRSRRLAVVHGSLDRSFPGVPGVDPGMSRRAVERARALGVEATYTLVRGAPHAVALRAPWGGTVPMPGARRVAEAVAGELTRFLAKTD